MDASWVSLNDFPTSPISSRMRRGSPGTFSIDPTMFQADSYVSSKRFTPNLPLVYYPKLLALGLPPWWSPSSFPTLLHIIVTMTAFDIASLPHIFENNRRFFIADPDIRHPIIRDPVEIKDDCEFGDFLMTIIQSVQIRGVRWNQLTFSWATWWSWQGSRHPAWMYGPIRGYQRKR